MDDGAKRAPSSRYYLIQCLRFYAALFVVAYHAVAYVVVYGGQLPHSAYYYFGELSQFGILIFFAISGFVITSSIQRRSSGDFIWLRFLRIYPGLWLAVVIVALLNIVTLGSFAWNLRAIFGLTLLPLGDVPRMLTGIEWTLVYEVFFYVLVAVVWTGRSNRILGGFCALWAVAITVGTVVIPTWGTSLTPTFPNLALSAYNYAFIGGVFAFYFHRHLELTMTPTVFALVPAFAIAGEFFLRTEWRLLSVSLAATCLVLASARTALKRDAKPDGVFTQWGDASYGLYLIHNSVISLVFTAMLGARQVHWLAAMLGLAAIGVASGLAYGLLEHRLYGYLKSRIRRAPWQRASTATTGAAAPRS